MTSDKEAAELEFFYAHAGLTGDCPHAKIRDCLVDAFLAGALHARAGVDEDYNALIKAHDTQVAIAKEFQKLFREIEPVMSRMQAELERLKGIERAAEGLVEAIRQSIARADDYGDSHCSQPIRQALAAWGEAQ